MRLLLLLACHALAQEIRIGDLLFVHVPLNTSKQLRQAIETVGNATLQWLENGGVKIQSRDTAFHVAIVENDAKQTLVEAVETGVRRMYVQDWLSSYPLGTTFYHGKVLDISNQAAARAAKFATSKIGLPYADFYQPPDTEHRPEGYYCSSLVDYAYREALGQHLVFTQQEFPLIFEPSSFWKEYFRANWNSTVPSFNGSNPTLLLHSEKVKYSIFAGLRDMPIFMTV